jgi:hypothetical protein
MSYSCLSPGAWPDKAARIAAADSGCGHPADGDVIAHSEPGTGGEYELALPEPSTADAELIGQQGSARL